MKTAMILAAGRGERFRSFTDFLPKALCKIANKPLIEHHVANLAKAGFERIVINHAYLGGKIRQYLGKGEKWQVEICYVPEPPGGLETGGGIYNALPLLGKEAFLTVNADIYTFYDFKQLVLSPNTLVKLVLVPKPSYQLQGDFGLAQGLLLNEGPYTFSGIAVYHPEAFKEAAPGRYSVTPLLRQLAQQKKAEGLVSQDLWFDIGSNERFKLAVQALT